MRDELTDEHFTNPAELSVRYHERYTQFLCVYPFLPFCLSGHISPCFCTSLELGTVSVQESCKINDER